MKAWFVDELGLRLRGFLVLLIGGVVLIAVIACAVTYTVSSASCERAGERLHRESLYDFWGAGCYVETDDGRMVPLDNLRVTNEERGE